MINWSVRGDNSVWGLVGQVHCYTITRNVFIKAESAKGWRLFTRLPSLQANVKTMGTGSYAECMKKAEAHFIKWKRSAGLTEVSSGKETYDPAPEAQGSRPRR